MNHVTPPAFTGNRIRSTEALKHWHAGAQAETALEPELPIVDAHHHLYGAGTDTYRYLLDDLAADIGGGHRVVGTVYVEAYKAGWRMDASPELQSLGEVERIAALSAAPLATATGPCQVAAAIVSHIDLAAGDKVEAIIEAHAEAARGRLRGVRLQATFATGRVGQGMLSAGREGFLRDPAFRSGYRLLGKHGLAFDALVFHTQLDDVADLADAFPDIPIVLNHVGIAIGVEEYRHDRRAVFATWREGMRKLAERPNVVAKIGGMGMPVFGFGFEQQSQPANSEALAEAWSPYMQTCVEFFGSDRCMLESNFPVDKQSCSYVALWNAFKRATRSLSATERADLFHGTACRAYGIATLPGLK
ncbi:amidohydrolase family protein [Caballeronia sp. LZ035]|uniref:amidohydrolase family protein n=1 Tax=Caballeronia sp. LZ035 TaxID=3038568 RepID=UPI002857F8C1|nr:amidohydrolase family protein [Caballeronia sp. LZ035]MDR5760554.1 amidohydrolase family protein [Caballeronia sp. LZ035]